jgi:hypothetical protein
MTGEFKWLPLPECWFATLRSYSIYHSRNCGKIAGNVKPTGYRLIFFRGKSYKAHRLAWLYMTGNQPQGEIDHIDGNRDNNTWGNLREVTKSQNCFNRSNRVNSKSKYKGVYRHSGGKYQATITVEGKRTHLGTFETEIEAAVKYNEAALIHHGEHARLNDF